MELLDDERNVLNQTFASAQGEWMTADFVDFRAEVAYQATVGTPAILVVTLNNPSDGEGRRRAVEIPLILE